MDNNQLVLIIGLDGFLFVVFEPNSNQYTSATEVLLDRIADHKPVEELYWEAFLKYPELTRIYDRVTVYHQNQYNAFVPSEMFDESQPERYLQFTTKLFETDSFDVDYINELALHNVFVPFVNLNNFLLDQFDSFEYHHFETLLCEKLQRFVDKDAENQVFAYIDRNHFSLYVFDLGKLLLTNTFEIWKPADFVYYLLFTAEQLHLNPDNFNLTLLGNVAKFDAYYQLAYQYIRNISLYDVSGLRSHGLSEEEQRRFFPVIAP